MIPAGPRSSADILGTPSRGGLEFTPPEEDPLIHRINFICHDEVITSCGARMNETPGAVTGFLERADPDEELPIRAHESTAIYHMDTLRCLGLDKAPVLMFSNGGWLRQPARIVYAVDAGPKHPISLQLYVAVHYEPNEFGQIEPHWVRAAHPMVMELAWQMLREKEIEIGYIEQSTHFKLTSLIHKRAPLL